MKRVFVLVMVLGLLMGLGACADLSGSAPEEIKIAIGSAFPVPEVEGGFMEIKGRNLVDGLPKNVTIHAEEVREALADPLASIIDAVKATLEKTPPELAADVIDRGITLTGGGALLRGLDRLISRETGIPVHTAESPLDCVAEGTGHRLENGAPEYLSASFASLLREHWQT